MVYLESFRLPGEHREDSFRLSFPPELEQSCYNLNSAYPFGVFPRIGLEELEFEPITVICGSNGSGKSTLLNIIAERLGVKRHSPFNKTPLTEKFAGLCSHTLSPFGERGKEKWEIITSDDVFDFLLDVRRINSGISRKREELFYEHYSTRKGGVGTLSSLEELEEFKRRIEAQRSTRTEYTSARLNGAELNTASNGESAYSYFVNRIKEGALYLIDEPENSLSPALRLEFLRFIEDSARFYGCQFIIGTHCPFIISAKGAAIYDLDARPAGRTRYENVSAVRVYSDFFANRNR